MNYVKLFEIIRKIYEKHKVKKIRDKLRNLCPISWMENRTKRALEQTILKKKVRQKKDMINKNHKTYINIYMHFKKITFKMRINQMNVHKKNLYLEQQT